MARKKNPSPFRPFEGRKPNDKHVRLTTDMLTNKTFMSLSYSAVVLYIYMKLWAAGREEVEYSWSIASSVLGSSTTFNSSKKELIEKGFIKITRTCKCSRLPNKYQFISDWSKK